MQFFLDILLARINLLLVFLLCIIYVFRKLPQKFFNSWDLIQLFYSFLRKHHKVFGALAILLGLAHGLLSSDEISTLNLGTLSWFLLLLLGITWCFRNQLKKSWLAYHRVLAIVFVGFLVLHISGVGGFSSDFLGLYQSKKPLPSNPDSAQQTKPYNTTATDFSARKLADGIYTGNSTGYRPGLVVQVTITQGVVTNIIVVSHNERDPRHYSTAMKQVPTAIIQKQSLDVDGVSGATKTANGIKNAVNDALAKASRQ